MRFSVMVVALLLAAAGCTNEGQTGSPGASSATPSSAAPAFSDTATTAATTSSAEAAPATSAANEESAQQKAHPDPNMKRLYQLHDLARTTVKVGSTTLKLWIMDTEPKREEGMMWLEDKDVKDNEGMIFVFSDSARRSFWMQNTVLALDIIYIGENKKVVNIVQGKPFDESPLPSTGPAMYVIELKKGMAKKFGIKPGMKLPIAGDVRAKG